VPEKELDPELAAALIDPAAVEALRSRAPAAVPQLPASNEGLEAEFFGKVHAYSRSWLIERGGDAGGASPCAFVLSRAIQQDIARLGAQVVPYLASCPDADVAGRLFISNDDLSVIAEVPSASCGTPAAIAQSLTALNLTDSADAIFRTARSEIIICRQGVLGPNSRVRIELEAAPQFSLLNLEQEIWEFHRMFTQTPSGYLLCWRGSPADRVTVEHVERQISGLLAFYLGSLVGFDNVSMEHFSPHGRLDVKVSGHAMVPGIGPCALELKVLRSRQAAKNSKGWTLISELRMIKHGKEGVDQAVEYRHDIGGTVAYLCCFDARLQDIDQPEVQDYANANHVTLRRYFMYESPAVHRTAAAAARSARSLLSGQVN
jgi:hypothetical protein